MQRSVSTCLGRYSCKVSGLSEAALSAYSIGASAAALPVPETCAMLGAGLAAIGFIVPRRRGDWSGARRTSQARQSRNGKKRSRNTMLCVVLTTTPSLKWTLKRMP